MMDRLLMVVGVVLVMILLPTCSSRMISILPALVKHAYMTAEGRTAPIVSNAPVRLPAGTNVDQEAAMVTPQNIPSEAGYPDERLEHLLHEYLHVLRRHPSRNLEGRHTKRGQNSDTGPSKDSHRQHARGSQNVSKQEHEHRHNSAVPKQYNSLRLLSMRSRKVASHPTRHHRRVRAAINHDARELNILMEIFPLLVNHMMHKL